MFDIFFIGTYIWTGITQKEELSPGWLWHRDEPDNVNIFGENCARFDKKDFVHGLSDANCNLHLHYFICEDDNHTCKPQNSISLYCIEHSQGLH